MLRPAGWTEEVGTSLGSWWDVVDEKPMTEFSSRGLIVCNYCAFILTCLLLHDPVGPSSKHGRSECTFNGRFADHDDDIQRFSRPTIRSQRGSGCHKTARGTQRLPSSDVFMTAGRVIWWRRGKLDWPCRNSRKNLWGWRCPLIRKIRATEFPERRTYSSDGSVFCFACLLGL